ncbi:hypothetical protein FZW96_21090 [Bacillus sp. BGMRC 2118]|nr:hypothetical protein FZW96_21090 [Bacillus sp. BGMRC 2118]
MKKNIIVILIIFVLMMLFGCSDKLTKEEAEKIALKEAGSNGYISPVIYQEFNYETTLKYQYSKKYKKDMLTWVVSIDTSDNPEIKNAPALTYYISEDNGEIIDFVSGIE